MWLWRPWADTGSPDPSLPLEERSGCPLPLRVPVLLPDHLVPTARWGGWAPGAPGSPAGVSASGASKGQPRWAGVGQLAHTSGGPLVRGFGRPRRTSGAHESAGLRARSFRAGAPKPPIRAAGGRAGHAGRPAGTWRGTSFRGERRKRGSGRAGREGAAGRPGVSGPGAPPTAALPGPSPTSKCWAVRPPEPQTADSPGG